MLKREGLSLFRPSHLSSWMIKSKWSIIIFVFLQPTWDYYNLIREIECTHRQLKNDLNLRPIYHQKDESSDAHLFFGLLAYWVVNTIRYELKQSNIKCYWTEITRRMSTQKLVTTNATNALGEAIVFRQCSCPSKSAKEIYDALKFKHAPFKKIQICRTQS